MDRIKLILIFVSVGLSFGLVRGQQIGNYVQNGSFEIKNCQYPLLEYKAFGWTGVDSLQSVAELMSVKCGQAPHYSGGYQNPLFGETFARVQFCCPTCSLYLLFSRANLKNRLRGTLQAGKSYCVKMFIATEDSCDIAIDGFGFYFGDSSIDTIKYNARRPLTFLTPQILNSNNNFYSDTMNWIPFTGTFIATGQEKYLVVANFKADGTGTMTVKTPSLWIPYSAYLIDGVSCIQTNCSAFAGPNQLIYSGDSVFIGRQPDFATDPGCTWYKLPNMTTPIDIISGLWVKPTVTSTYVVRQELDCSPLKWDTVVVTINTNYVSLDKLHELSSDISLFPNPTSGNLKVSYFGSTDLDITSYLVINSLGQTVRDVFVHDIPVDIQTSDLGPGLYEIQFKSRYGILTKKFVRTD